VRTAIKTGGQFCCSFVANLLQYLYAKIVEIYSGLTKLLQNKKGAIFLCSNKNSTCSKYFKYFFSINANRCRWQYLIKLPPQKRRLYAMRFCLFVCPSITWNASLALAWLSTAGPVRPMPDTRRGLNASAALTCYKRKKMLLYLVNYIFTNNSRSLLNSLRLSCPID